MLQGQAELDERIWNEFLGATVHKLDDDLLMGSDPAARERIERSSILLKKLWGRERLACFHLWIVRENS